MGTTAAWAALRLVVSNTIKQGGYDNTMVSAAHLGLDFTQVEVWWQDGGGQATANAGGQLLEDLD